MFKVKHSIRDLGRGQYQVLYYPALATTHKVEIKYNGLSVPDSPVVLNAKNPGKGRNWKSSKTGIQSRVLATGCSGKIVFYSKSYHLFLASSELLLVVQKIACQFE